jgi:MoaA/NifB/PqqE/SkfB family radical SAM enzyme
MRDLEKAFFDRNEVLIDLTHRCPLECPRCQRQLYFKDLGKVVPGKDISLETIDKLTDKFEHVCFGGQLSDPIHHPKFIDVLKICHKKSIGVKVQTASSHKSMNWYREAWQAHPDAQWQFGIDGLPEESHNYRVNQDGKKLFEVMCDAKSHLNTVPIWQYIIFKFNEGSIEKVKQMAKDNELRLLIMYSSRWLPRNDPLKPSNPEWRIDNANI